MSDLVERLRTVGIGRNFKIFAVCNEAADRIEALEAALRGLIEAVRIDSDEGGKGISGNTGARLYDARIALTQEQEK